MGTKTLFDFQETTDLQGAYFVTTKGASDDYRLPHYALENELAYKDFKQGVGKDLWFNDDPQYQDKPFVDRGLVRWVLNGTQGTREEYPEYCQARGITEETFIFSDYKDGTIANNPVGSGEPNGLYKLDTIKKHTHPMAHDHDMSHQHDVPADDVPDGGSARVGKSNKEDGASSGRLLTNIPTTGGRDRTGGSSTANTGETGDSDRTQMRHTLVKIYIKAKFLGVSSKDVKKVNLLAERITKTFYENEIIESLENLNFVVTNAKGFDYILPIDILEKSIVYDDFLQGVGKDLWFNDDPQYQDMQYVDRGLERWVLSGTQGTREEYPEYCQARGITTETFIFSDYKDGTIANNPINSGEANGLYKLDTIKKHKHDIQHDHEMNHQHNLYYYRLVQGEYSGGGTKSNNKKVLTTGGRSRTGASSTPNTGEAGSDRTQMRHTLVQIYILAKFLE